jgi:tRNA A-37 threonylcarbamoyl transferase component Bud32
MDDAKFPLSKISNIQEENRHDCMIFVHCMERMHHQYASGLFFRVLPGQDKSGQTPF